MTAAWRRAHPTRGWLVALVLLPFAAAGAGEADPFRTRNLSPLSAIFGLPTWEPASRQRPGSVGVVAEAANHYRLSARGGDLLIMDGETWRLRLLYEAKVGEAWSIGFEIPYYRHYGGVLDDLIDGWHSLLALPDGGRNRRSEDLLHFELRDAGRRVLEVRERAHGLGDAQVSIARSIADGRFLLRAILKLATGDEEALLGSGAGDLAVTVLRQRRGTLASRPAGFFWGAGLLRLGNPEWLDYPHEELAYLGMVGGGWNLWPRVGLKAQLDVHSPLYDSPLEELGETAVQATIGGWLSFAEGRSLEFAVIEDLHVSTSPDVVLHLSLRWSMSAR